VEYTVFTSVYDTTPRVLIDPYHGREKDRISYLILRSYSKWSIGMKRYWRRSKGMMYV